MEFYRKTETGWVLIYSMGGGFLLIAAAAWLLYSCGGLNPGLLLGAFAMLTSLVLFYNMTVSVDHESVKLSFGIGLIKKRFLLYDIKSVRIFKNPWYTGYGIKYIGNGWLFNVNSRDCVELKMKNNRIYRIGTPEPEMLKNAIISVTPPPACPKTGILPEAGGGVMR